MMRFAALGLVVLLLVGFVIIVPPASAAAAIPPTVVSGSVDYKLSDALGVAGVDCGGTNKYIGAGNLGAGLSATVSGTGNLLVVAIEKTNIGVVPYTTSIDRVFVYGQGGFGSGTCDQYAGTATGDGAYLTFLDRHTFSTGSLETEIWYLKSPPTGAYNNVNGYQVTVLYKYSVCCTSAIEAATGMVILTNVAAVLNPVQNVGTKTGGTSPTDFTVTTTGVGSGNGVLTFGTTTWLSALTSPAGSTELWGSAGTTDGFGMYSSNTGTTYVNILASYHDATAGFWSGYSIVIVGTAATIGGGEPPQPGDGGAPGVGGGAGVFVPVGGTGGGGGGGGLFVSPPFVATCGLGAGDWLLATTQPGSRTTTINDARPEAALAILYLVNWGDKEFSQATSTPINHTYKEEKLYNVTVLVQYRNNVIEYFVTYMDVRGNNCALQKFSREIMPILWALGAFSVMSAAIVTGARYRIAPNKRRALRRMLLTVGIVTLGSVMAIVVYAYFAGIPI